MSFWDSFKELFGINEPEEIPAPEPPTTFVEQEKTGKQRKSKKPRGMAQLPSSLGALNLSPFDPNKRSLLG